MTTTLGLPLVGITMTALCDGQCGGEVTIVTDVVRSAMAETKTSGDTDYIGFETESICVEADGSIEVYCNAQDRGEQRCSGRAVFTRADIEAADWHGLGSHMAHLLGPMDRA